MSGFDVCAALKADPVVADVPIIFVTSHRDEAFEVAGFAMGAADFIAKPVSPPLVLARVKAQLRFKRMSDELRETALVDSLTGVANRRQFDDALAREWRRAKRGQGVISLVLIDVDHFKLYNDRYGHPAGDSCLRSVAQALQGVCRRAGDLVARYGGEEFALLLPETPAGGAAHVAERSLGVVGASAVRHAASPVAPHVTISAGVASFGGQQGDWPGFMTNGGARTTPGTDSPRILIDAADRALYAAKKAGRARFCLEAAREGLSSTQPGNPTGNG